MKKKTKHLFCDSMLSLVFFIIYFAIIVIVSEETGSGLGLKFFVTLLSYCSSLVLPEYVDAKYNNKGSKIVMWLTRVMFLLGVIYAIYDITRPCGWFCFRGIKGFLALLGLIIFPLIIVIIYILIVIIYILIIWIINKKRSR